MDIDSIKTKEVWAELYSEYRIVSPETHYYI